MGEGNPHVQIPDVVKELIKGVLLFLLRKLLELLERQSSGGS